VKGKNAGGRAAPYGGIAIQVREAFDSSKEVTETHSAPGSNANQQVFWKGQPFVSGILSQYLHIEPTWDNWAAGVEQTLTATITPIKGGTYHVYAKMYLNDGSQFPRDPAGSTPNTDHQGEGTYMVGTLTVQ
jgi:hypothetical protein